MRNLPVPIPGTNFIILEEILPEDVKFHQFSFYAGNYYWSGADYVGCIIGTVDDPIFVKKLRYVQGIMNIHFGALWHQTVSLLEERKHHRLDNLQKYTRALSKLKNAYNVRKSNIIAANKMFADDELRELENELQEAMIKIKDRYGIE